MLHFMLNFVFFFICQCSLKFLWIVSTNRDFLCVFIASVRPTWQLKVQHWCCHLLTVWEPLVMMNVKSHKDLVSNCFISIVFTNLHTHTHNRLTALCQGLPGWAGTRKVKPVWIFLKQETVSINGISCAICRDVKTVYFSEPVTSLPKPVFYGLPKGLLWAG